MLCDSIFPERLLSPRTPGTEPSPCQIISWAVQRGENRRFKLPSCASGTGYPLGHLASEELA